ncbi:MAG: hypothetical protein M1834_003859 [Cirrosporium novae-zelandiae]|nr:MAG: hypothetical protein M1834_003859 [Cirrosporium novae-zelandiae]
MTLTLHPRPQRYDDSFPAAQLFILAICRVAEPIALTSIFPYAWVMVQDFEVGDRSSASFYAGVLISAFALSEALTGLSWGGLSDRYGRKPILLLGMVGTTISLLVVGFARNFWVALLGRSLGGLLNGNIGVIQTMVGELVKRPEHEPRAYAVMPFVWSIGTIIGPVIGGTFVRPAVFFPGFFSPDGLFGRFPYLLPNLICAVMLLIAIVVGHFLLLETHPDLQPWSTRKDLETTGAEQALMATAGSTAHSGVDLRGASYGTFNSVDIHEEEQWNVNLDGTSRPASVSSQEKGKVFTKQVVMLVLALGIFSYHSMTYDHLLPIFLQDERADDLSALTRKYPDLFHIPGGLGLSTQTVGFIMSINGLIALFIQAIVFPFCAERLGVWHVFLMVTILHPIAYFIVPYLAYLPGDMLYTGIYACLTIRNFFSILAYPVLLILIKQASPSNHVLGAINGFAASAGAAARTIAPPVAGLLYGIGTNIDFTGLAWYGSGIIAIVGAIQLLWVKRDRHQSATVKSVVTCVAPQNDPEIKDVVHISVTEDMGV